MTWPAAGREGPVRETFGLFEHLDTSENTPLALQEDNSIEETWLPNHPPKNVARAVCSPLSDSSGNLNTNENTPSAGCSVERQQHRGNWSL
jgi:hypothetical protein